MIEATCCLGYEKKTIKVAHVGKLQWRLLVFMGCDTARSAIHPVMNHISNNAALHSVDK